jgi:hypothetical protein
MEESATTQTDEEATSSLRARDVEASSTLGTFARADWKKMMVVHLDWHLIRELLRTRGLKEGAAGAVGE